MRREGFGEDNLCLQQHSTSLLHTSHLLPPCKPSRNCIGPMHTLRAQEPPGIAFANGTLGPIMFAVCRTFAFDDGQLSVNSSESEVSEHIYEEIKDQSSDEEDEEEESSVENESFMLSISLERRNNLKLYGCLDWDFKPVSH